MKNKQKPGRAIPHTRTVGANTFTAGVQQLAGGPGPTFDALGKTWRLGFNDQNAKAALEELIRAAVVRREDATCRQMGADGDDYWKRRVQPLLDSGHYTTFKPGWVDVMRSEDGSAMFLQSLLLKHHPDATAADAREMFADSPRQVIAAVEVVAPDFFAAVAVQLGANTDAARAAAVELAKSMRERFAAAVAELESRPEPATASTASAI